MQQRRHVAAFVIPCHSTNVIDGHIFLHEPCGNKIAARLHQPDAAGVGIGKRACAKQAVIVVDTAAAQLAEH